jgi:hypothetical protein
VQQRVHGLVGDNPDVAPPAAVASGRTAAGHEFLATKGRYAISAVATVNANLCPINKHDLRL